MVLPWLLLLVLLWSAEAQASTNLHLTGRPDPTQPVPSPQGGPQGGPPWAVAWPLLLGTVSLMLPCACLLLLLACAMAGRAVVACRAGGGGGGGMARRGHHDLQEEQQLQQQQEQQQLQQQQLQQQHSEKQHNKQQLQQEQQQHNQQQHDHQHNRLRQQQDIGHQRQQQQHGGGGGGEIRPQPHGGHLTTRQRADALHGPQGLRREHRHHPQPRDSAPPQRALDYHHERRAHRHCHRPVLHRPHQVLHHHHRSRQRAAGPPRLATESCRDGSRRRADRRGPSPARFPSTSSSRGLSLSAAPPNSPASQGSAPQPAVAWIHGWAGQRGRTGQRGVVLEAPGGPMDTRSSRGSGHSGCTGGAFDMECGASAGVSQCGSLASLSGDSDPSHTTPRHHHHHPPLLSALQYAV